MAFTIMHMGVKNKWLNITAVTALFVAADRSQHGYQFVFLFSTPFTVVFITDSDVGREIKYPPLNSTDLKKKFEDLVNIGAKLKEENSKARENEFKLWRKDNG